MILGKAGANDDVVCAGIMHDVIEDTKFSYENIEKGFGSSVADLVKWVSENKDVEFLERKDIVTVLYGASGTGKTNFCLLAAVSQAKKGNKVLFIDTEGGFSVDRVKQLVGEEYESVLKNIFLLKPLR
jgi:(p)ppGpp synthase/HD superfamily hydrolase